MDFITFSKSFAAGEYQGPVHGRALSRAKVTSDGFTDTAAHLLPRPFLPAKGLKANLVGNNAGFVYRMTWLST